MRKIMSFFIFSIFALLGSLAISGSILVEAAFLNPLAIPTYDGSNQSVHPSVLHFDNGWKGYTYWMAFSPYPNSNDDYENPSLVVSNDRLNWVVPSGLSNPIDSPTAGEIAQGFHMSDSEILMVDGRMEYWYRFTGPNGEEQLFRKSSTNGIDWSAREMILDLSGTGNLVLSPSVIYEDGKYRLWFCDYGYKVCYMESATGTLGSWSTKVEVELTYRDATWIPWHLSVFKDNGEYVMLLTTMLDAEDKRYLLTGSSRNGLKFTDLHLILSPSPSGWDNQELYRSSTVRIGNIYSLYYSAMSYTGRWRIGLAEGNSLDSLSKVFFSLNFETSGGTAIASQSVADNCTGILPVSPTKPAYDFLGWYKEVEGINAWDFASDKVTSDTTLYAKWNSLVTVLAGADRFATAVEISKAGHDTAQTAILAAGTNFPDALSAGPLAVLEGAPILLTNATALPQATKDELVRLGTQRAIILGGEDVVGTGIVAELNALGIAVERVSGDDRYKTAVEVARKVREKSAVSDTVALATGLNFPDALSIGSYAAKMGIPILLTGTDILNSSTRAAVAEFGIAKALIVGGPDVVSQGVEDELTAMGIVVTRTYGNDRYATSIGIAERYFPDAVDALAATGLNFPDALAAVPYAVRLNAPIILVTLDAVPSAVRTYLSTSAINRITVCGDEEVVSLYVREELYSLVQ